MHYCIMQARPWHGSRTIVQIPAPFQAAMSKRSCTHALQAIKRASCKPALSTAQHGVAHLHVDHGLVRAVAGCDAEHA